MAGGSEVEKFEKHCFGTDKCETELSKMIQNIYIHAQYITKYMTLNKNCLCILHRWVFYQHACLYIKIGHYSHEIMLADR